MVRCAFDTTVIKVEAVNVDICFHKPLNTETAVRRSRTRFAEATTGGYASIIARNSETVKQTFFLFYSNCFAIRCPFTLHRTAFVAVQVSTSKIRYLNPPSTSYSNSSGNQDQTREARSCDTKATATAGLPAKQKSAHLTLVSQPGHRRWRAGACPLRRW